MSKWNVIHENFHTKHSMLSERERERERESVLGSACYSHFSFFHVPYMCVSTQGLCHGWSLALWLVDCSEFNGVVLSSFTPPRSTVFTDLSRIKREDTLSPCSRHFLISVIIMADGPETVNGNSFYIKHSGQQTVWYHWRELPQVLFLSRQKFSDTKLLQFNYRRLWHA